jgi:hypothetical protein
MHDAPALVPLSIAAANFDTEPGKKHSLVLCSSAAASLIAMGLFAAGLPVVSVCMLALSGMSSLVIGSAITAGLAREQGRSRRIAPEEIASEEVRATYRAILHGLTDVERALAEVPRLSGMMSSVLERCCSAVELSGRIALLANPLQRYLDRHNAAFIRAELDRLRSRAEATMDQAAIAGFRQAAAARERQLAVVEQIVAKRDQVCARLELVRAALDTFAATIVKLHTLDEEQVVLAGASVAEHLDGIGDDLAVLESALELDLAAA